MSDLAVLARASGERVMADIEALAQHRDPDQPGWTRIVFSEEYAAGRRLVEELMGDAGLDVRRDAAGNVIGVLRGAGAAGAICVGSHTDTVRGGGRFDGTLGVLGAIEMIRVLRSAGTFLDHDVHVVDFLGEEPNLWGVSCLGSRAVAGCLDASHLAATDAAGRRLADALADQGIDPARMVDARWSDTHLHASLELHIEQGPVLENVGAHIGVVSGIVGVDRFVVRFDGQRDHAGTTPMDVRHDALAAAAALIVAVERAAGDGAGVATVGRIAVEPGSINVVPSEVLAWVEIRSIANEWIERCRAVIEAAAREAGARRGVGVRIDDISNEAPTPAPVGIRRLVSDAVTRCGLTSQILPSGAEHDSRQIAALAPYAMLFVPSHHGRSHCPEEWTDAEALGRGVAALVGAVTAVDAAPRATLELDVDTEEDPDA